MSLDQARPVRPGEELPHNKLSDYLHAQIPGLQGELTITQFPGGHSNLTYLLTVGERQLVLRRPPFGRQIKSAHDMGREYFILSRLIDHYPQIPQTLAYCEDVAVLGAPFYVMERLHGVVLRARPPKDIQLTPDLMAQLSTNFIDNLAAIHSVDLQASRLAELGKPQGYVARQISGWTRRYHNAQTDDLPKITAVAAWLAAHQPPERGAVLIHNDYKYDNLLLNSQNLIEIRGVFDWEMSTIGDPLMDLGVALGYWIDPDDPPELRAVAFGPTALPGNLNRLQLAERYAQQTGRALPDLLFYYVYALFKLAVIAQQIYARYKSGHSQDPRFADFIDLVRLMGVIAGRAIALGRIDRLG